MSNSTFIATEKFPQPGLGAERKVWQSLKKAFAEQTCLSYWRYPLFSRIGERKKEPDILLLDQTLGVIVIEVKGLNIEQVHGIDGHLWQYNDFYTDSGNPYEQAENHLFKFLGMSEGLPELRRRVAGRALVALPNITRKQWQEKGFDQHPCCPPILFQDDLAADLLGFITETTPVQPGPPLDDGKWQRLCAIAGNTSVLKPAATQMPQISADQENKAAVIVKARQTISVFDREQETAAKQIPEGPQRIRGIAGSGKTVLLCQKAAQMHLKHPDWDIALVFFTRSLYDTIIDLVDRYIKQFTNGEQSYDPGTSRLKVFHAWGARDQPGLYGEVCNTIGIRPLTVSNIPGYGAPATKLCIAINQLIDALNRQNRTITPLYDAILIDEGQDLVVDSEYKQHGVQPFYWMAYNFCKPVERPVTQNLFGEDDDVLGKQDLRRLIWAYDEAQCLESPVIPTAREVFGDDHGKMLLGQYEGGIKRSIIMHRCHRTPGPILTTAHAIGMGLLRNEGMISGVTNKEEWKYLGYEVSGNFATNTLISLHRPKENSPNPIPAISTLPSIELKFYDDRWQEIQAVADKIAADIQHHQLTPHRQLLVVVLTTEAEQMLANGLNQRGINFYIPSATQANVLYPRWPDNNPNRFWCEGAVTISGIHRAKGNEAEMVYVVGLDEIASKESSVKHRNQLFVAMTRAKGWVHISGLDRHYALYDEFIRVLDAKGDYQFYPKGNPQRDLADTDLPEAWSEVTTEVSDKYHSFIIDISDKIDAPVLAHEITFNEKVVAQPLLSWPDKRVAIVESQEDMTAFDHQMSLSANVQSNDNWTIFTLGNAAKNSAEFLKRFRRFF